MKIKINWFQIYFIEYFLYIFLIIIRPNNFLFVSLQINLIMIEEIHRSKIQTEQIAYLKYDSEGKTHIVNPQ